MEIQERFSEFETRRISNIVWTIIGDYSLDIDLYLIGQDYFSYPLVYKASLLGLAYRGFYYPILASFHKGLRAYVEDSALIMNTFYLCFEEAALAFGDDLPNLDFMRKESYRPWLKIADKTIWGKKTAQVFRKAYMHKFLDLPMVFPQNVKNLIDDILTFRDVSDVYDFIGSFKDLVKKYFAIDLESSEIQKIDEDLDMELSLQDVDGGHIGYLDHIYVTDPHSYSFFDYKPNEYYSREISSQSELSYKEEKELERLDRLESIYGRSIFPLEFLHELEDIYAVGKHEDFKLYFSDGDMSNSDDSYWIRTTKESQEENYEKYLKRKSSYDQSVSQLVQIILQKQDQENTVFKTIYGKIMPKQVYRADLLNDNRIFKRDLIEDKNELKVDIVLDSSASLKEKESILALQAYMISAALEDLRIDNSIKTFNNFIDYTIIKVLKTYEDKDPEAAFKYFTSGGNRDGLALELIGDMEGYDPDVDRIMIVFTDAMPYDVQSIRFHGQKLKKPYQGRQALIDTAQVVGSLRRKGLKVYGFYAGAREDMTNMRKIYGNDFVYVDNINRFARQVGRLIGDLV